MDIGLSVFISSKMDFSHFDASVFQVINKINFPS